MSDPIVAITGVGTATPLGLNYPAIAHAFLSGVSGIRNLTRFDTSKHASQIAGLVPALPTPPGIDPDMFAALESKRQLLLWCGIQALSDSGCWYRRDSLRIGLVLGLGGEWLLSWEEDALQGGNRVRHPEQEGASLDRWLQEQLGLRGPVSTVAAACASGNIALGVGRLWVQRGWVDLCVAGACDCAVTPMGLASFGNLGALSKRNDDPSAASRPFDSGRDGFVMGEGGAPYVLENVETARRRGSKIYAEIIGFGASSDAFHLAIPSSDPSPAANAIQAALDDAHINPEDIDYINAHATSTNVGDPFETRAILKVFGEGTKDVPVSGTKSMTGHLLSAAAAVEVLACLTAFEHGAVPPTINLHDIDPDCQALRHVANQAEECSVSIALSNSFGFGGCNTSLILRKAG